MGENTTFDDILTYFLASITDYSFLQMTEEDIETEITLLLRKSLANFFSKESMTYNETIGEFSRKLTDLELNIIINGMLFFYLDQRIYNISLIKQSLSTKDFAMYSQQQHLATLLRLKQETNREYHYLQNRYELQNFIEDGDI